MSDFHEENYRTLIETLIVIAAGDYIKWYWKKRHRNNTKYKTLWEERYMTYNPDPWKCSRAWTIHCRYIDKQVDTIERFLREEISVYCDLDAEEFIQRLRRKAMNGKKTFYETV